MKIFLIFLYISICLACQPSLECNECKKELCFFLKLFDGNYTCSVASHTEFSKFQIESCDEIDNGGRVSLKDEVQAIDIEQSKVINTTNSTHTSNRYGPRLVRNFCHQARLIKWMKKSAPENFPASLEKMINNNPFVDKREICLSIIRARREERLKNCTACGSLNNIGKLGLGSDRCNFFTKCVDCVSSSTCNYIIEGGHSYCANTSDPTPAGGTVIPPNESLWCPDVPPESKIVTYEIGFWILACVFIIGICSCLIMFIVRRRTRRTNLPNSPELYLLNNLQDGTLNI